MTNIETVLQLILKKRPRSLRERGRDAELGTKLFLADGSRASGQRLVRFFVIR